MDFYNASFFQQLAPLVKVHIASSVDKRTKATLLERLLDYDVLGKIWDESIIKGVGINRFNISVVETKDTSYLEIYRARTSILLPFNPDSDLFPNGILSHLWVEKYTEAYPFVFIHILNVSDADSDQIIHSKTSLLKFGIHLVVILVGTEKDESEINNLRATTQLSRSLIFTDGESDIFPSLFKSLAASSNSFYSTTINRIQKRNDKYYNYPSVSIDTGIDLTPAFLETRNLLKLAFLNQFLLPTDLSSTIKLLESAYNNLSEILTQQFNGKLIPEYNLSEHDLKIYIQFRTLMDILAFHIVRGYFSLNEPVQALKKHGAHVVISANIIATNYDSSTDTSIWQAIQFKWLGELMELVPEEILTNIKVPTKPSTLVFSGGIKYTDRMSYQVFLTPDLNYLHAYSLIKSSSLKSGTSQEYLISSLTEADIETLKLDTLKLAANFVELELSPKTKASYINWLLAEEFESKSPSTALYYYENSLKFIHDPTLQNLILLRLLDLYEKSNQGKFLLTLIQLTTFSGKPVKAYPDISLSDVEGVSIAYDMFKWESLIFGNLSSDTYIYEDCTTQLSFGVICNIEELRSALPSKTVELKINKIEILYNNEDPTEVSGLKPVTLSDSGDETYSKYSIAKLEKVDDHLEGSVSLKVNGNDDKVIQFLQPTHRAGTFKINTIKFYAELIIDDISFSINQTKAVYPKVKRDYQIYHKASNSDSDDLVKKWVRFNTDCHSIQVKPVKPNIQTKIVDIENVGIGEKLVIPVDIKFTHPVHKQISYKVIELLPIVRIVTDSETDTELNCQIHWDDLKDDEGLDIQYLTATADVSKTHNLHLIINKSPSHKSSALSLNQRLIIDIESKVIEVENEIESVYSVSATEIPIVDKLFNLRNIVSPRFDEDDTEYMPSPFALPDNSTNLPIPVRLWQSNVEIELFIDGSITNIDFDIKTNNDVKINTKFNQKRTSIETKSGEKFPVSQTFTTKSSNGYLNRTVSILTTVKFNWQRKGSDILQTFESDETEITLPLSDPRVLMQVKKSTSPSKTLLRYIIENPTPRVFTFTTNLNTEEWDFSEDKLNFVPLNQEPFPVLPFSRHVMDFHGDYSASENQAYIKLPNFKVYDVNYKFSIPVLSVDENVVIKNGVLYLVVK